MRLTFVSLVWAIALSTLGCNSSADDEPMPPPDPAGRCAAGEWQGEDGGCIPAGLPPDMACPPGEWLRDDGACIPAGVPPDGCGHGFAHDGDRGCEPILPEEPCPPGLMAVPGETVCREVAPCAAGKWGDIRVEPNTEYVDASYPGMDSDGSVLKPWTSIQAAVDAAAPGAIVAIAEGNYLEDVTVSGKPVRLWGVCPALVEVVGTGAKLEAVEILAGASATEVTSLAIGGNAGGVLSSGSVDVVLEHIWIHDIPGEGVHIESTLGPTSIAVRASLVEQSHAAGVFNFGSTATLEGIVVRDIQPMVGDDWAAGVEVQDHPITGMPGMLLLKSSLVERSHRLGVHVDGADAIVEASVVRDTFPTAQGLSGRGLNVRGDEDAGAPSTLLLKSSLVERSQLEGVFIEGANATIEASVVRDTVPDAQGLFGRGVDLMPDETTEAPATLVIRQSLIDHNHDIGVFIAGSEATIEATVVRDTQPNPHAYSGGGISAHHSPKGAPTTLVLRSSVLERNHQISLFVNGSSATVEASVVRETTPDAHGLGGRGLGVQSHAMTGASSTLLLRSSVVEQNDQLGVFIAGSQATVETSVVRGTQSVSGFGGYGVAARASSSTGTPSTLLLRASLVEQSHELGLLVSGSEAAVESCLVSDTMANGEGYFGDGVMVISLDLSARAAITGTRIDRSTRAAVAAVGAYVALGSSKLSCQALDLDYEIYLGTAAKLEDLGNNRCGCPEATGACKALTTSLEPPLPIEPSPDNQSPGS